MGSFDPYNCHHGVIWGAKHEVPFTEKSVKRIMFTCIKSGKLTLPCLASVRCSFSFAYRTNSTWFCISYKWV